MLCMGNLNNIMNVNEKLGPTRADVRRLMSSALMLNSVDLLILVTVVQPILGLINDSQLTPLLKGLIDV